jgi:tetratricopeptide (TPR) repeat protein
MSIHLERASLLFGQSRYDLAEKELRQALSEVPDSGPAHALLALCLSRRQQKEEAIAAGERAVGLAPDLAFCHYALADALYHADRLRAAADAIAAAIELEPTDADHFALQAAIRFDQRDWPGTLAAAEQGLSLDPEHVGCTNLRAMALVKLGRKQEAGATLAGALERDPESALSHANQGWTMLEQSRPAEALNHFREALRIDPSLDWARQGVVEALKARHLVYRLMLRFFLWMAKLSGAARWGVVLGVLVLQQGLGAAAPRDPILAAVVNIAFYALVAFVVLTWVADALFNLLLRLNRFGRLALSRDQVVASNWVGAVLGLALAALAWGLIGRSSLGLVVALITGVMVVPVAGVFRARAGGPRAFLALFAAALAAAGYGSIVLLWLADHAPPPADERYAEWGLRLIPAFGWGVLVFTFTANAVGTMRRR